MKCPECGAEMVKEDPRPKIYKCGLCGRPIRHRGNCLACNVAAKRQREYQEKQMKGFV
jgi:hypothetical protein